jgi:transposase-like protein
MICLVLSPEEKAQVEQARRTRPQIAERCHYVLLSAEGWSVPQLAQPLDRNEHTIRTWLKAYQTAGLPGLHNTPPPGRPPKARASPPNLRACWPRVPATSAILKRAGPSLSSAIISSNTTRRSVTQPCVASCRRGAGSRNASPKPCPATLQALRKKSAGGRNYRHHWRPPSATARRGLLCR